VSTLHILRSEPDDEVRELIQASASSEVEQIRLYEEAVDYDQLVDEILSHDRVICWW
jgi:hypothetical protein